MSKEKKHHKSTPIPPFLNNVPSKALTLNNTFQGFCTTFPQKQSNGHNTLLMMVEKKSTQ